MAKCVSDDIAVVGIAHKLPKDVEDDAGFWDMLQSAKNQSSGWPKERMNADAHPHPRNGNVSNACCFLEPGPRPLEPECWDGARSVRLGANKQQ